MSQWTIEVCSTCGRLASWPFCEHRPTRPMGYHDRGSWCEPVIVAPTNTRGRELAKANLERAVEAHRPGHESEGP